MSDNTIDADDAQDGSEGGYDRHGNYIVSAAMKEIVGLRNRITEIEAAVKELEREKTDLLEVLAWKWHVWFSPPEDIYQLGKADSEFAPEAICRAALEAVKDV